MSEVDDIEAIRRLTNEYAMAVDTAQLDALVDLFVPEAVFDPGPGGIPVMNNREEIQKFFEGMFEGTSNRFHLTSNHIIDVDGDSATGTAYYAAAGVTSDGASFSANGYYNDAYVRTAGGWKFLRRQAVALIDPNYSDWDQAQS